MNNEDRINGDPTVPAPLTEHGRAEAALLGLQVRALPVDACLHTRFDRTLETARIALDGRDVPLVEEEFFDDVRVGELEGWTVDEYRDWKRDHVRADRFPGGESLDEAARRYATAYRNLLERPYGRILVVCHEIPIRYALNVAGGSHDLDRPVHAIPNALPFLFGDQALADAAARIELLAGEESRARSGGACGVATVSGTGGGDLSLSSRGFCPHRERPVDPGRRQPVGRRPGGQGPYQGRDHRGPEVVRPVGPLRLRR